MKTHHIIKSLIHFVDDDASRYYDHMEDRRKKQNKRFVVMLLALTTLAIAIKFIVQFAH